MKDSVELWILTLGTLGGLAGCGLVPIPVSRTLPDPIREIAVTRQGTGESVTNAEVVLFAVRFEKSWMRSWPPRYAVTFTSPGTNAVVIPLHQASPGLYRPERRRVTRQVRFWGIGPLGTTLHEDYALTLSVRADGCLPVTATYAPAGSFNAVPRLAINPGLAVPQFDANGTLRVSLREESPNTSAPDPVP
jgi:hypothetical protein